MRDFETKVNNTAPATSGVLDADEDNVRFQELEQSVFSAGITLDPAIGPDTDKKMLAQAMARYASGGVWYQDSGGANAYVLSTPLAFIMPKTYFQGLQVTFAPGNDNTGAATASANGIGAKPIFNFDGSDLSGDEILAGRHTTLIYDPSADSANGGWLIAPWCIVPPASGGGEANTASNVGSGVGVFKTKSGTDLRFKSLKGVNGVSVTTSGDNEVHIDGSGGLGSNLPFYPHVLTGSKTLTITDNGGGQIEVDTGQQFLMRGLSLYNTSDYSAAQRQFATLANKTYHLRFTVAGGFALTDMSALVEEDAQYDTTLDDMLVARVVTDGSNVPTITSLVNQNNQYDLTEIVNPSLSNSGSNGALYDYSVTRNYARTPAAWAQIANATNGSTMTDIDKQTRINTLNRYVVAGRAAWDFATSMTIAIRTQMVGG